MRVAGYLRVSTSEQAENNYSLDNQLDKFRAYCSLHNHTIAGEYVDPGYSGTTDQRPGLAGLLRDVEAGLIDAVVVYRLDRFFRSQRHLYATLHLLEQRGVGLVSVTESFDTTTSMGRAMLGMLGTFAALERDTFLERSSDGMRKMVRAGKFPGGIVAYGYRYDDATRELAIQPDEADIIRRMYQWSADGLTTWAIATRLNDLAVPTKYVLSGRGIRGKATANVWRPGRVYNMLVNPAYKGEWSYGKRSAKARPTLTAGTVPAIVTPDAWESAQTTLRRNATHSPRNAKREYLLSGLLKCVCGYSYIGYYYDLADGREVRYYRCSSRVGKSIGGPCALPPVPAEYVESLVWQDVQRFLSHPEIVRDALEVAPLTSDDSAERSRVDRRLADVANAEARLLALYTSGALSRDALDREASRLDQERQAALRWRAEVQRTTDDAERQRRHLQSVETMLKTAAARLGEPTFAERRDIIRAMAGRIVLRLDDAAKIQVDVTYTFPGVVAPRTDAPAERNHAGMRLERVLR